MHEVFCLLRKSSHGVGGGGVSFSYHETFTPTFTTPLLRETYEMKQNFIA